jgi:hypothetical protein
MDVELIELIDDAGLTPIPPRPEGFGITVKELMELKRCGDGPARKSLQEAVKAGILQVHRMSGRAGALLVYHKAKDWPPK